MGTYAFKDQFYLTKQIERSQNLLICKTKQYKILNEANKIVFRNSDRSTPPSLGLSLAKESKKKVPDSSPLELDL